MEKQTFKKRARTGMHVAFLSEGSKVNGQPAEGRQVLRPGNTVFCFSSDLGIEGRTQFDLLGSEVTVSDQSADKVGVGEFLPILRPRGVGYWDVINPATPDKPYNDKALRKGEAEELLRQLTEGNQKTKSEDIDLSTLSWDDLVKLLEDRGVSWNDNWETEDDLRKALKDE